MPTEHASDCEFAAFELCTCGLQERERARRAAQARVQWQAQEAAQKGRQEGEDRRWRARRAAHKALFVGALVLLFQVAPWAVYVVLALWGTGKSLLWLVEAHGPLYSDSGLRGPLGYLKFMLG